MFSFLFTQAKFSSCRRSTVIVRGDCPQMKRSVVFFIWVTIVFRRLVPLLRPRKTEHDQMRTFFSATTVCIYTALSTYLHNVIINARYTETKNRVQPAWRTLVLAIVDIINANVMVVSVSVSPSTLIIYIQALHHNFWHPLATHFYITYIFPSCR